MLLGFGIPYSIFHDLSHNRSVQTFTHRGTQTHIHILTINLRQLNKMFLFVYLLVLLCILMCVCVCLCVCVLLRVIALGLDWVSGGPEWTEEFHSHSKEQIRALTMNPVSVLCVCVCVCVCSYPLDSSLKLCEKVVGEVCV